MRSAEPSRWSTFGHVAFWYEARPRMPAPVPAACPVRPGRRPGRRLRAGPVPCWRRLWTRRGLLTRSSRRPSLDRRVRAFALLWLDHRTPLAKIFGLVVACSHLVALSVCKLALNHISPVADFI